ncbi:autotransporter outer membrane beta-barrel domain-containing protein [Bradyrhizobium sp. LHD-71]|uniref:autotransporter family protein n=1 Tax=Bradyrhizobium sp. LHD-71 TaxID=3072141 RepID=UPI00280E5989|nr:autotransporter outer membrane beta-barrel domain-containing protein [Bradyrhizobium sp. LHD-71]MDQ8728593.1 autotransporter outer membrane beta-barrel domain-containing protein [Bradyrhizobium sp. LHD-71]
MGVARTIAPRSVAFPRALVGALMLAPAYLVAPTQAHAQCVPDPPGAGAAVICSGVDPNGFIAPVNTALTLDVQSGATVQIAPNGNAITFATSVGVIGLTNDGTVNGNVVSSGTSVDIFSNTGTINGNVDQGSGDDSFTMTGGLITGNLEQSGGRDIFFMSAGTIAGAFIEGDIITVTGGSIGSVNMNVGNNVYTMSGGTVVGDVIGFGNDDTFNLSGGFIGGNVNLGNGVNSFTVTGGQIVGTALSGTGVDTFVWNGGGTIGGGVNLGAGNDRATLQNLTAANLVAGLPLDGGAGVDSLTFNNTRAGDVARFLNWETIDLTAGSQLTFSGTLTLGDAGTGTGALSVDPTSTVFAGQGAHAVAPFTAGQLVTVTNAGLIDLTNGPPSAADSLTIFGNYVGQGGRLALNTVLGSDGSASDRLVISNGAASGSTGLLISNLGGPGALTTGNGILVVEGINGGTTANGTFALASAVAAGPFEYLLFRGGLTPGTEQNFYLRSSATPSDPVLAAVTPPVPLLRTEVPQHSTLPPVARQIALSTLGTFHERQGDQGLLRGNGFASAGWARAFGGPHNQSWRGDVAPSFDGDIWGIQVGLDLIGVERPSGHSDRAGVFYGFARMSGDLRGTVVGERDRDAGSTSLEGNTFGGYWTHIGPPGWYLDGVVMHTWLNGNTHSLRNVDTGARGGVTTASLEGGYPIVLDRTWSIEPQGQIIWQRTSLRDAADVFSPIGYDDTDAFVGRLGVRLQASVQANAALLKPYLKANVWHTFAGTDTVTFATTPIALQRGATAFEIGGGLAAQVTRMVSVYGAASYTTNLSSADRQSVAGNLGLRLSW